VFWQRPLWISESLSSAVDRGRSRRQDCQGCKLCRIGGNFVVHLQFNLSNEILKNNSKKRLTRRQTWFIIISESQQTALVKNMPSKTTTEMYAEQDWRDGALFHFQEVYALQLKERAEACSPASWPTSGWVVFSIKKRINNFTSKGRLDNSMRINAVY